MYLTICGHLPEQHMGEYYRATSVEDACDHLAGYEGQAEVIAGGQTLMLNLRHGLIDPGLLVDISDIEELRGVSDEGETVRIGGATTYAELGADPVLAEAFPFFSEAIAQISGPQVRNHGTIGGGLCYGDPALDSPPVLLSLDAEVTIQGPDGTRSLPLTDFFVGYYETAIEPAEVLTHLTVPKLPDRSGGKYRTMAPRQGDYAVAGVAVRLTFDGGTCAVARLGLTNAGDTPKRATGSEAALEGTAVDEEAVEAAVDALDEDLDIIGDEQTPRSYRETVFKRLTRQTIRDVREALGVDA